jgi:hypothetical protein
MAVKWQISIGFGEELQKVPPPHPSLLLSVKKWMGYKIPKPRFREALALKN